MLSKKKIKVMFKLATYENGKGKKDLKDTHYYKNDFVRLNILKSLISMTLGYILILSLVAMYNIEFLITNAVSLPYKTIALMVAGIYILLAVLYIFISILVYSLRYDASRKGVQKYFKYLKYLKNYYKDGSEESGEEE